MKRRVTNTVPLVVLAQVVPATTTTVRVYQDSNGSAWLHTYLPIPANDLAVLRRSHARGEINLEELPLPVEDERAAEMKWLQENRAALAKYSGEWVAVDGPRLVAHGIDLPTVVRKANEAGAAHPFITSIPGEPITDFYG
jgi:hypothetical protein